MERGFFKIHRKIEDSKSWSRGALYRGLMITLLEKANWKRGFFHGQEILPGQLAFSGECLADELDIPRTSVVRMLRNLELDGFLTRSNMNNRYTLVTITNWHSYQSVESDYGQQMVNQRSTDGRPVDTIKEGKKERINTGCVLNACARVERQAENPDTESVSCRTPSLAFDEFFDAYPAQHRGGRIEAEKAWVALEAKRVLPGLPKLFDALAVWEDSSDWKEQGGRYVPTLENFLAREYWLRVPKGRTERSSPGVQERPKANTVAQKQAQDNDDMAKMLLQVRRAQHAQFGLHASTAGQSGTALPTGR